MYYLSQGDLRACNQRLGSGLDDDSLVMFGLIENLGLYFLLAVHTPVIECPQVTCVNDCHHGYVKDADGCTTCGCISICPDMSGCVLECPNGFARDISGCDTCSCGTDGISSDPHSN